MANLIDYEAVAENQTQAWAKLAKKACDDYLDSGEQKLCDHCGVTERAHFPWLIPTFTA